MKRILTWVKPTWNWMHVWNYFWAIKPIIELSKTWETFLFIADYHSLTSVHDWKTLRQNKFNVLAEYFSLIPDDSNIIIYEQSKIDRINDIMWVLTSVTPYSLMLRAHSFKDSQNKNHEINMATFLFLNTILLLLNYLKVEITLLESLVNGALVIRALLATFLKRE